ncbi:MAG: cryptochrome/photolyase family protein [Myxococcota bacterium]
MNDDAKGGRPAYFVAPWDLDRRLACVPAAPEDGSVVLVESHAKGRALPWNRKKLVLVLSAMRHFAAELERDGYDVEIVNAPSYAEGIRRHVAARGSTKVVALVPREEGLAKGLAKAEGTLGAPLELHDDGGEGGHFLLSRADALAWAATQKPAKNATQVWRQDRFYAFMRKRTGWLMEDGKPVGGKYSFDADNRKPAKGVRPPDARRFPPDAITREVMERVAKWPGLWGDVEGFAWPVTRAQALEALDHFVRERAPSFGPYQDAMLRGEPFMWHALLSVAMNLSLLHPREVCESALRAYEDGAMPLASCEGFLRQVMGWREFMRLVYLARGAEAMREANTLGASRPLPAFFWEPEKTDMACLREAVTTVRDEGYAHHIQRLMVLGNFALLAGVKPIELSHWFWAGFVDAYEWVELPNVHGMALYADDTFTTKPYAASASYIHKMSDHCRGCAYDRTKRTGEDACPFNALFWSFLAEHRELLSRNYRIRGLFRTWERWDEAERQAIRDRAEGFLASLEPAEASRGVDDYE